MTQLDFPIRRDYTRKRHHIDILLKKAIKGNEGAKKRLHEEYGIKVYSSSEIEEYAKGRNRGKIISLSLSRTNTVSKKQTIKTR
jgi:hypothetical protein